MLERELESWFVKRVKALGGRAVKFAPITCRGLPDRIVWWGNGVTHYIELKTEKGKLSPRQVMEVAWLNARNYNVQVLYGKDDCERYLKDIQAQGLSEAGN